MHFLSDLKYLAIGGVVTSLAEYLFNYNLIDLLKDKVLGLFGPKAVKK